MAYHHSKLSKKEVNTIFYQLCSAIAQTKSIREATELLRDLLSYQEAEMIAKRLKIAQLLLNRKTYEEIQHKIKVSPGTISRVQEWIKISGEGYRKAIKNFKKIKNNKFKEENYHSIMKKYPMYYWPQILVKDLAKTVNKKQQKKIKQTMNELEKSKEKSALFKKIKLISKN